MNLKLSKKTWQIMMNKSNTKEKTNEKVDTKFKIKDQFKIKEQRPKPYKVMLLNNHITSFQAVTDVLKKVFKKGSQEAQQIMMVAHQTGRAIVVAPVTQEEGDKLINEAVAYCLKKDQEGSSNFGRPDYYTELQFELEEDE